MNKINTPTINNIPSTKKNTIGYRTVTNSSEQNKQQEDILNDILDLFNKANKIDKSLSEAKEVVDFENKYLQFKLADLEAKMINIAQKYKDSLDPTQIRIINIYPQNTYIESDVTGAYLDLQYSDITLQPIASMSKVNLYDAVMDTTFIPPSLRISVNNESLLNKKGILSVTDNELSNPFNGDLSSYWIRKVVTDETINEVTTEMIITLPEDIITTRDINQISISPYPTNAVDIMGIDYRNASCGSWIRIPDFESHVGSAISTYNDIFNNATVYNYIPDAPNVKFNFNEISSNQIRIILRQRHYISGEGNTRIFCMGAKEIQVLNNRYTRDFNTFSFRVDFPEKDKNIIMCDVEPVYNNYTSIPSDSIQIEYYYLDDYDVAHKIVKSIPFTVPSKKMIIKCKMYKSTVCPNLNRLKIKYKLA